jgi:signal transduction histidine kinase
MFQATNNPIIIYYLAGTLFFTIMVAAIIFYIFIHQKRVNSFRNQLKQEEIKRQKAIYAALQDGEEKERSRIAQE